MIVGFGCLISCSEEEAAVPDLTKQYVGSYIGELEISEALVDFLRNPNTRPGTANFDDHTVTINKIDNTKIELVLGNSTSVGMRQELSMKYVIELKQEADDLKFTKEQKIKMTIGSGGAAPRDIIHHGDITYNESSVSINVGINHKEINGNLNAYGDFSFTGLLDN